MTGIETRPLGRTPLRVTIMGLGCATIGGHRIPVIPQTAKAVIRAAWAAGLRYFDTAPFYGSGQSERCVGDAAIAAAARFADLVWPSASSAPAAPGDSSAAAAATGSAAG